MAETVALTDGGHVEWWVEEDTANPRNSVIHVQKFDSAGNAVAGEYTTTLDPNYAHAVLALDNGGYVVGVTQPTMDGMTLRGAVFQADGGVASNLFGGSSWHMAASPDGGFVVGSVSTVHHGFTVPDARITLYDSAGSVVTSAVVSSGDGPAPTVDADGVYHVTWNDRGGNAHELLIDPDNPPSLAPPPAPTGIAWVDDVGPRTGALTAGGGTDDGDPIFRIPVTETGWVAVEVAYAPGFASNAPTNPSRYVEITDADVARGYVEVDYPSTGPYSDNNYKVAVRFEDDDGLVSGEYWIPIRVDTHAEGAPTFTKAVDDAGAQQGEVTSGGATDDTSPAIQISLSGIGAQPFDKLLIFDNGRQVDIIHLDAQNMQGGTFTWKPVLAEGDHAFTARISDFAGNIGAVSTTFNLKVGADPEPPPSGGQVINSSGPGSTLTGGDGDDTLNASQGPDQLTGGAGADVFRWSGEPWAPATVTDFHVGEDRLDFGAVFQQFGYAGSDPVGDRWITLQSDGSGGTQILFDHDGGGPNPQWPNYVIHLEGVSANGLSWAQLTGGAEPPPPPASTIQFDTGGVELREKDDAYTAFNFLVLRSGDTSGSATVNWSVGGYGQHSAQPADFQAGAFPSGTLTFAAGESSKTLTVYVQPDDVAEVDEQFTVTLFGASGAGLGAKVQAVGTIADDDASTPSEEGEVIISQRYGDTLVGGSGADTILAGRGPDQVTGGDGADEFIYRQTPWSAGHLTDFHVGEDRLDLSELLSDNGYSGSDPVADGWVSFVDAGGSTQVFVDTNGPASGGDWPFLITTLDGVSVSTWAQLSGGGGEPPPPPPPPEEDDGQVLTSDQYGDVLAGGSGDDTLNAGQGPDQLTGAGGADRFVFGALPWNAGHVTDFTPGADKLDLSGLGAGQVELRSDGGNTQVYFDPDDPNAGQWPYLITTLDGVSPSQLSAGDWIV